MQRGRERELRPLDLLLNQISRRGHRVLAPHREMLRLVRYLPDLAALIRDVAPVALLEALLDRGLLDRWDLMPGLDRGPE